MIGRLTRGAQLIRQYGLAACAFRMRYGLARRYGWLKKRFPQHAWEDKPLAAWCHEAIPTEPDAYRAYRQESAATFFFATDALPRIPNEWHPQILAEADAIVSGRIRYFSAQEGPIGAAEDWFRNPFTGTKVDGRGHWSDTDDLDADQGDIKVIWEPARFSWVFTLARAYAASGDDQYAKTYWRLFESWRAANPPQTGPHWQCGQECAFRLFALCFGFHAFFHAASTTPERLATAAATIAVLADRIDRNIAFALSQKNNHGVSEAAGLYTAGTLFPEFKAAERWRRRGKTLLEREGRRQIYADGSYVQHSMNYHRVMLHDYLWVLRLAELNNDRFGPDLTERLGAAVRFLYQMQDDASGRVPNYGANDGALVLPLSTCDYLDYRPVLQTMWHQLHHKRLYASGPWDEPLLWLAGADALRAPPASVPRQSVDCHDGGYYTLRAEESWAMIRCHTYRDRPAQADMLHVDLWWRGENILRDAGTYSYNCLPPWNRYFISAVAHNTLVVDGVDQMIKGPRFMWFDWIRSKTLDHRRNAGRQTETWQGEHYGYRRRFGVVHRRTIERIGSDAWTVIDDVLGAGNHEAALYWHLPDVPWKWDDRNHALRLDAPVGAVCVSIEAPGCESTQADVVRGLAEGQEVLGWESLYYGVKTPRPVLRLIARGQCPMKIVTRIGLGRSSPSEDRHLPASTNG